MHRLVRVRLTKTRQERNTDSTTISHAQAQEQNTVDRSLSSVDLNPLDLGLLLLRLGHDHGEHPVLHARLLADSRVYLPSTRFKYTVPRSLNYTDKVCKCRRQSSHR